MTTFLSNRSIYESVICGMVPEVRSRQLFDSVWRGKNNRAVFCRREFCGDCSME
jgi:hypothetical protein